MNRSVPFVLLLAENVSFDFFNRFSQDLELVDMALPTTVAGFISAMFHTLLDHAFY